jgi:DNA mismatch endonuclease (patch repair protein)
MAKMPATRPAFWAAKINANRARDRHACETLHAAGWRVLVVWECSIRGPARQPIEEVLERCERFVRNEKNCDAELAGRCPEQ